MKIGLDLDNVLNNLNEAWIRKYNVLDNDNLTIEDIKSWDIHNYVKIGEKIYHYLDGSLLSLLQPLENSIEVTKRLTEKHELFIVTATELGNVQVKLNWLDNHFPHIKKDNIIVTNRKELINVDLLIDDAPHNITSFPRKTIVFDYAWNRELSHDYPRVYNWLEIEELINNIYQGGEGGAN